MIQIKPLINGCVDCGPGRAPIPAHDILWQGIHVCAVTRRDGMDHLVRDLPIGHSARYPFTVNLAERSISEMPDVLAWLGRPLLQSLLAPNPRPVEFCREVFHPHRAVIILNCLDCMYGHCLLKLLCAERHLAMPRDLGLVVLIPSFLRWLVPDGVAEVWTVNLGVKAMMDFYPALHQRITEECQRFETIYLSSAREPGQVEIANFTRVLPHDFNGEPERVTFIWREDRPWLSERWRDRFRKWHLQRLSRFVQQQRMVKVFAHLKRQMPELRFCVAGLGHCARFPDWIEDHRVSRYDAASELADARLYARSRVVLGVHGSSMLLPSALAGMTIDLLPIGKWDNLPVDLVFQEKDPRKAVFRYRCLPIETKPEIVSQIAFSMMRHQRAFFDSVRAQG